MIILLAVIRKRYQSTLHCHQHSVPNACVAPDASSGKAFSERYAQNAKLSPRYQIPVGNQLNPFLLQNLTRRRQRQHAQLRLPRFPQTRVRLLQVRIVVAEDDKRTPKSPREYSRQSHETASRRASP